MRELLEGRARGDDPSEIAVAVYLHRLQAKIAAMFAAMRGADALVFTGGVGEHAAAIRAEAGERLGWLGVAIDDQANLTAGDIDTDISSTNASSQDRRHSRQRGPSDRGRVPIAPRPLTRRQPTPIAG